MEKRMFFLMLLATFIWGTCFVAQAAGMEYIEPFTFIAVRSIIAAVVLAATAAVLMKTGRSDVPKTDPKRLIAGGVLCGVALFFASSTQQIGLVTSSAGKGGFITSLYIIAVPVFGLFFGRRPQPALWISIALALVGMYLLSIKDGFKMERGDVYLMICALCYAVQILLVDRYAGTVDAIALSAIQFGVCALLSSVCMFSLETPVMSNILACWLPLLYASLLSACVAYTIQIFAQKYVEPTKASLLMCMESVFALLSGFVILGEKLSGRELIGCALMFAAILIAARPGGKSKAAGLQR